MENYENNINEIPETEENNLETETKNGKSFLKEMFEWVEAIAIAVIVALLLRNYVLTFARVEGASMEPSLQQSNMLYVNKVAYTPEKGDIVVFEPASAPNHPYIKRVIATEGDSVYIDFETGDVYINGEVIDEPYINGPTALEGEYIKLLKMSGKYDRQHPIVIPEDHFWAMGDNRNNSRDSRSLGPIPEEELMGHAIFRFWPVDKIGTLDHDYE